MGAYLSGVDKNKKLIPIENYRMLYMHIPAKNVVSHTIYE
jgi:hypothetical protein